MSNLDELDNRAVFVNSCDKTSDVAVYALKSIRRHWSGCEYPIYIGCNINDQLQESPFGHLLGCPEVGGWKKETLFHLRRLKEINPQLTHLILILDDFVIGESVDHLEIEKYYNLAVENNLPYLRLKRIEQSFLARLFSKKNDCDLVEVKRNHPYYSSLQIAIWDIDYLISLVNLSNSIWDFETLISDRQHYSVLKDVITYQHIVEKGKWNVSAKKWCVKSVGYFYPGTRSFNRNQNCVGMAIRRLIFLVIGYSALRVKRYLRTKIS